MEKFQCKQCQKSFGVYDGLRRHMSRVHKVNSTNFYVEFYLNGIWPLCGCGCGCGEKVKWSPLHKKFREFARVGHLMRVRNNWGHNQRAIDASSETRKRQFASGERTMWSKGKSIKTDPLLQSASKKLSERYTEKIRKEYSDRMRKMRKDGTIPTLFGEESSQWAGGVSSIKSIAHCSPKLHQEWRYPIFIRDDFKCTQCQSPSRLQVHHDLETMASIVRKFVPNTTPSDLSFDIKKELADKIVDYHINNKITGITLCASCHNKLHPSLNFL